jgi:DNA polymerase/3'-5' exonuclease PolX
VRRRLEVAGGIDLAVATDHPHRVLAELEKILGAEFQTAHLGLAETTLPQGVPLRLTLAAPAGFGAAWLAATGNADHFQALADLAREHHLELPQGCGPKAYQPAGKGGIYQRRIAVAGVAGGLK